ncbi:GspH/FimT family pseudopilin [Thalassomonas sp. M1454]|uniref:GspH/FimT family pseudopilin n=1 Tax=Thalassomonas sp. M1454 TaxID=2594477 RepID=UPI00117D6ECA|nr:GspH/FimT family pseudopilin [Thalassomonas sp. M1454]TRX54417.1 prepilin-type N-terminal cleavage/methylation domain-containing protein [Thalassomonas sp. M1454]
MKKTKGLTLIEVLITILIISILAGVAGPSFLRSFDSRKLVSATEQLYSHLQLARSESLTRSASIYWTANSLGSKSWAFGFSTSASCDPLITSNTAANACVLNIDDGDGNYVAADDDVLHRISGSDFDDITIRRTYTSLATDAITFDHLRGTIDQNNRYYTLTSALGSTVRIHLTLLGRVKICSDDLSDYKDCN